MNIGVPDNKVVFLYGVDRGLQKELDQGIPFQPSAHDSFVMSLGGLNKKELKE